MTATGLFADGETHAAERMIRDFLVAHPAIMSRGCGCSLKSA